MLRCDGTVHLPVQEFLNNRTNLGVGAPPRTSGARGLKDGRHPGDELRAGLRMFRANVNSAHSTPEELPQELLHGAALLMRERPPWEAQLPLEDLARLSCGKLVISGGHSQAFDAVCDSLALAIGARRAVLAGRGHTIPSTGAAYNALLHWFMTECEESLQAP